PWHHADDCVALAIQHDLTSDHAAITAELRLPEPPGQKKAVRAGALEISGHEDAPQQGPRFERGEEVRLDGARQDAGGLAEAGESHRVIEGESAEAFE